MNVIIIEDEKLSAEYLAKLIERTGKDLQVIAVYDSVKKSLKALQNGIPADLLFVDIHLGDGLSFDIFSKLKVETPIIFTTAYNEYAIKAFKLNSIDYLLKPIDFDELNAAIEKYIRRKERNSTHQIKDLSRIYESLTKSFKTRFMVKTGDTIVSVQTEEILHFIAEDGIVLLRNETDRRFAIDYSLEQLEELIDPQKFFRINRKVLLNINAIQKTNSYFNSRLKIISQGLSDDDCIVSRERVNDFKKWLGA